MQTIKCFEVYGHTDTTEGRGPMKVVARFFDHGEAVKFVQSKAYARWCVMGFQDTKYDVNNIKEACIVVLDNVQELEQQQLEETKMRALAKLTKEERAALGL